MMPAAPDQDVAQAVAAVHDRGVDDVPFLEVDRAEVVPVGEREAPGPAPQEQELDDVRETRLLEAALDRHQRHSSMTRSADLGPLPHHLLPAARRARRRRATMPLDRPDGRRWAPARAGGTDSSSTSRASAALGGTPCAVGGLEHALQQGLRGADRVGGPRRRGTRRARGRPRRAWPRDRARSTRSRTAASGGGSSTTSPPSRRERSRGSTRRARPAARPSVNTSCRPDSISALKSTNSSSWVRSLAAMRWTSSSRNAVARR